MAGVGKVISHLRPRSAGLRLWLALSFGLLAVAMVGVLSWQVERVATDKLQDDIGLRLQARALALAGRLDRGLFERLNDMRALALMPMLDNPEENEQVLRDLFDLMQLVVIQKTKSIFLLILLLILTLVFGIHQQ